MTLYSYKSFFLLPLLLAWASGSGFWHVIITSSFCFRYNVACRANVVAAVQIDHKKLSTQLVASAILSCALTTGRRSLKLEVASLRATRLQVLAELTFRHSRLVRNQSGEEWGIYRLTGRFKRLFYKSRQAIESRPSGQSSYKYNPKTREKPHKTGAPHWTLWQMSVWNRREGGGGFKHTRMASSLIRHRWATWGLSRVKTHRNNHCCTINLDRSQHLSISHNNK